jgi:hypothetical protein
MESLDIFSTIDFSGYYFYYRHHWDIISTTDCIGDIITTIESIGDIISTIDSIGDIISTIDSIGDIISIIDSIGDIISTTEDYSMDVCNILRLFTVGGD